MLHEAERVLADDRDSVSLYDVEHALEEAVKTHALLSEYQQATQSPQPGNLYEKVLLACAFAPRNDLGRFRPSDVRRPLTTIADREMDIPNFQRHLHEFSSDARGRVLQRHGKERNYTFQFGNPLMQPFVKIRALARGTISEDQREQLQAEQEGKDLPTPSGWIEPNGSEQLF